MLGRVTEQLRPICAAFVAFGLMTYLLPFALRCYQHSKPSTLIHEDL